ncbi:MAG TPA: L,D-transpeptidase, partial [Bacteroidales bacterium]
MEDERIINDGTLKEITHDEVSKNRKPVLKLFHGVLIFICSILVLFSLFLFLLYGVPVLKELTPKQNKEIADNKELKKDPDFKKKIGLLTKDVQRLSLKFNTYTSGQSYIVVNTTENRFYLYNNKQLIRAGSCSTGSYKKLLTEGGKNWTFKTPRGKFTIQNKRTHPAWHRP